MFFAVEVLLLFKCERCNTRPMKLSEKDITTNAEDMAAMHRRATGHDANAVAAVVVNDAALIHSWR